MGISLVKIREFPVFQFHIQPQIYIVFNNIIFTSNL
ncbi:hypothetical protein OIU74_009440 [Salix koriyanagi]|uniref:Uncharacterized protein n=1 Tax=Salix koriyanagi TaxID=2511006 RepID=A0A9Q0Z0U0_9ROSI|nr:hypothetical protein OIU74_009440 [Salix koriyanagi]